MDTPYHTKMRQTTATDSTAKMENYDREDHGNASCQTTNTTHCIIHQEEATPNHTEHNHHREEDKKNKTQHQRTHQPEEEEPGQLCNMKREHSTQSLHMVQKILNSDTMNKICSNHTKHLSR